MEEYEKAPYVGVNFKRITGKYDMLVWGDSSRFEMKERVDFEKFKAAEIHAKLRKLGFRRKGEEAAKITESAPLDGDEEDDDVPDVGKDEL